MNLSRVVFGLESWSWLLWDAAIRSNGGILSPRCPSRSVSAACVHFWLNRQRVNLLVEVHLEPRFLVIDHPSWPSETLKTSVPVATFHRCCDPHEVSAALMSPVSSVAWLSRQRANIPRDNR